MENMKKITKVTAGVLSFALALSSVGSIPFSSSAGTAAAAEGSRQLYEYEIRDLLLTRTSDHGFEGMTKPAESSYYVYGYDSMKNFSYLFDPYNLSDQEYLDLGLMQERNREIMSQVDEGSVVTISFTSFEYYPDLLNESDGYENYSSGDYQIYEITSLRSADIHYYGDINDDGFIDSFDVIMYRKALTDKLAEPLTDAQFTNADINRNLEIDEEDLQQVIDYTLGKTKEFNGASAIGSIRLDNTVDVLASEGKAADEEFAKAEMNLGVNILKKSFSPRENGSKNFLISPVSISTALAMTANGADGNTRDQMEQLLGSGLTLDQINEYMAYYKNNLPDEKKEKLYLANSIWFRDDPTFKVQDGFLETNKKFYDSEIYQTPFNDTTVDDINSWVNNNTKSMIPQLFKHGDLDPKADVIPMMTLINTLYFEAEWEKIYEETDVHDQKFTDINGEKHDIKGMYSQEYCYYDLGDADAFRKYYKNRDFSFVGILPKENDIESYVNNLDADKLLEGLKQSEDPSTFDLFVTIPKFKYNYDATLKDVLRDLGMEDAFDETKADFSKINDLSVEGADPLYIGDVIHKTRIEMAEKGTKAAAVTAVMMIAATAPVPEKKEIHIELTRPFVYMILDKNDVPVFIGAATQLEEN
ncbi:MAG: hypothetical protein IKH96_09775 [Ruminococcus sp.]|uniref:serpin family protein n=1 Tax=Ruminococcus sp. TaxID=41978 RepID=UPI0025CC101D|nr:serpin family protein [Ruminococcus sp.]MBR6996289.1 hypothetical protein [Ruminococcus sp.]